MKVYWAIALIITTGATTSVVAAESQRSRTLNARSEQRPSLGEAMERVYAGEIESVISHPPVTLDETLYAALSWRYLSEDRPAPKRGKRPVKLDSGPLTITIDKSTAANGKATVQVTKKYNGDYYRRYNKGSRVKSTASFRHTWMNDGSRWLLMTIEPLKADVTVDGKAFTPDKKHWNPNTSFRAPTPLDPTGRESGLP